LGYFYWDFEDSSDDKIVFNRIVNLKDSWIKATKKTEIAQESCTKPIKSDKIKSAKSQKSENLILSPEAEIRLKKYQDDFGLNTEIATIIAKDDRLSSFFEKIILVYNNPTSVGNWVANELSREIKDKCIDELPFDAAHFAELIELSDNGTISIKIAREIFTELMQKGGSPKSIVESRGLIQITDENILKPIIDSVMSSNPENLAKYKEGRTNLLGFFVGQVIKKTNGKANPQIVNKLVIDKLSKL